MDIRSSIDKLKQQGFVNMGSCLVGSEEIDQLNELVKNEFENPSLPGSDYKNGSMNVVLNLLEHVPYSGVVINNIVSNPLVKELLEEMLGVGYKIWSITARRAVQGDRGLFLHQDGVGQLNLFLSLDDNLRGDGASVFLPSSHLIETSMKKLGVEVPPAPMHLFPFMFKRLSGLKGNIGLFCNKTWHGRWRNLSSSDHIIVSIGFFPAGYNYYETSMSEDLVSAYSGTELGRLLAGPSDLPRTIPSSGDNRESGNVDYGDRKSFSLNIEDKEFLSKFKKPPQLLLSVMILRIIMFFMPLTLIFRKIKGK